MKQISFSVVGTVLGLVASLNMAVAGEDSRDLPALTAQWWQWALSIPTGQNPQLDPTGQYCMVGQRGSVWFLGGVFSGGPAERTCSVPEGVTLFFPVINDVSINSPNVCGSGPENASVRDLRNMSKSFIDAVPRASVKVQLDGNKISFRRIQSQVFAVALPNDNVFDAPCGGPGAVPAGIYSPAVDDGYYATLGPLKPRADKPYTIHFQAEQPTQPLPTDVTYTITVVPVMRGN